MKRLLHPSRRNTAAPAGSLFPVWIHPTRRPLRHPRFFLLPGQRPFALSRSPEPPPHSQNSASSASPSARCFTRSVRTLFRFLVSLLDDLAVAEFAALPLQPRSAAFATFLRAGLEADAPRGRRHRPVLLHMPLPVTPAATLVEAARDDVGTIPEHDRYLPLRSLP